MKTFQYFDNPNRSQFSRILFVVFFSLGASEQTSFAKKDTWCLERHATLPCNGASGNCVMNSDGTKGGFVADTATLEKVSQGFFQKPLKAYIGIGAQVCGRSIIGHTVQIRDQATVTNSRLNGAILIGNNAKLDRAHIRDTALITGNAVVKSVAIKGNIKISDAAFIDRVGLFGNIEIKDQAHLSETHIRTAVGPLHLHDGGSGVLIQGHAKITESNIRNNVSVGGNATIEKSLLKDKAQVFGNARVEKSTVSGHARIYGNGYLAPNSHVSGNVQVYDNGEFSGYVTGDLHITEKTESSQLYAGKVFDEINPDSNFGKEPVVCKKDNLVAELGKGVASLEGTFKVLASISEAEGGIGEVKTLTKHFSGNRDEERDCCPICFNTIEIASLTSCEHLFCRECIHTVIKQAQTAHGNRPPEDLEALCPFCKKNILHSAILNVRKRLDPPAEEGEKQGLPDLNFNPERFNRFR